MDSVSRFTYDAKCARVLAKHEPHDVRAKARCFLVYPPASVSRKFSNKIVWAHVSANSLVEAAKKFNF